MYLWENYLEINSCRRLFLVGVGDAHYGVVHLINTCDCLSMLQGVVNVVSDAALRSVRRDTDSYIAEWYKAVSPDGITVPGIRRADDTAEFTRLCQQRA